jgi:hypothetical protein
MRICKNVGRTVSFSFLLLLTLAGCAGGLNCSRPDDSDLNHNDAGERTPREITVALKAGKYNILKGEHEFLDIRQKGENVRMEGFYQNSSPGDPALPVRIYDIAVPPNIDWSTLRLSVDGKVTTDVPGRYNILPAPPNVANLTDGMRLEWGEDKDISNGLNMNVYRKDRFFPEEPIRIVSQSQLRKWRFVRVEFTPVQYNPVSKSLRVIRDAEIHVNFAVKAGEAFRSDPLLADPFMDDVATTRFINYDEALKWYAYAPSPASDQKAEDPDMVIITTRNIRDNSAKLADFAAHKISKGHSVRIVTEDEYEPLTGQGPNRRADKIRKWLMDNYVALGIHYVLLMGDPSPDIVDMQKQKDWIPMQRCWPMATGNYSYNGYPTDYYYADLTGDWDLNGNGLFCELTDNPVSPDPAIDPNTFSIRWSGQINSIFNTAVEYTFHVTGDYGARLVIDNSTVIDTLNNNGFTDAKATIQLSPGLHPIQLHYTHNANGGQAKLQWIDPSSLGQEKIVNSDYLYHLVNGAYVQGGLDGEYFKNADFRTLPSAVLIPRLISGGGSMMREPAALIRRRKFTSAGYLYITRITPPWTRFCRRS